MRTTIPINEIKNGNFAKHEQKKKDIDNEANLIEYCEYYHKSVAGQSLENQLAIMRNWLIKDVGLKPNGHAKKCVIIVDYIKIMNQSDVSEHMQEYQSLGFLMSSLHNFAVRYDVPILALVQLNRGGIHGEDTDAISGSDRILWLCSSLALLKDKDAKEIETDGSCAGNKRLTVIKARHGAGTEDGEYINYQLYGECGKIVEGKTNLEIARADIEGLDIPDKTGEGDIEKELW